jgi:hypothetical protein
LGGEAEWAVLRLAQPATSTARPTRTEGPAALRDVLRTAFLLRPTVSGAWCFDVQRFDVAGGLPGSMLKKFAQRAE